MFLVFSIALVALLAVVHGKAEDKTITVAIPKGYAAPRPIPKDSWEDRMKKIMAQGLESEALASTAESEALQSAKNLQANSPGLTKSSQPRRALTMKHSRARRSARKVHARNGRRGRHGRTE
jgi:hypothetical protein